MSQADHTMHHHPEVTPPSSTATGTSSEGLTAPPRAERGRTSWAVTPARAVAGPEPRLRPRLPPTPRSRLPLLLRSRLSPMPRSRVLSLLSWRLTISAAPARGARPPTRGLSSRVADQSPRVSTDRPPDSGYRYHVGCMVTLEHQFDKDPSRTTGENHNDLPGPPHPVRPLPFGAMPPRPRPRRRAGHDRHRSGTSIWTRTRVVPRPSPSTHKRKTQASKRATRLSERPPDQAARVRVSPR
jgi:hypothetical protein